jgi:hypothetical protein
MGDSRDDPILSRLADDPAEGEAIDAFVVGLAARVDTLQDYDVRGALAPLCESVAALAEDADKVGFDSGRGGAQGSDRADRDRPPHPPRPPRRRLERPRSGPRSR